MKGLIYKDYIVIRKTLAMGYIYCFLFAVVGILCRLSMICGNLAGNTDVINSIWIFRYFPCVAFMAVSAINTIFTDKNCGWDTYCATTSIGEKSIVTAKMLFNTILMTLSYIISMIYIAIFMLIGGKTPDFNHIRIITGFYFFFLVISYLGIMLSNLFRKKQTVDMVGIGIAGVFLMSNMPYMFRKLESYQGTVDSDADLLDIFIEELRVIKEWFLPVAFVLALITGVLCFILSVKALKRRKN